MAYFTETFSPVDALTTEDIVFLQNLADDADFDSSNVLLGLESPSAGAVNGSNTTFTFAHSPKVLFMDGSVRIPSFGYTVTGSGPYTVEVDALIPPTTFIRGIY